MSDIVNNATIRVDVDATGVDAGLRRIEDGASRTGKNLDNLGATAKKTASALEDVARTPGLEAAGDGAGVAAGRMDRATKNMADSIQRTLATMNAGAKGSAQYYEALANSRGLDVNALRPFLNQLDEMSKKSALAADAQRKLDESTRFLDSLRTRTEGIGKSASELAALRAQQLGVSEAAAEMIEQLRQQEEAGESSFGGLADMAEGAKVAFLAVTAAVAAAAVAGAALIGSAIDDLAELDDMAQKTGSSVESLSKIQKLAAVFGTDMGAIDGALTKLSKGMAGLDEDSNKVQKALKALGVSSKDAAGNLRDPSEVLVDAARSMQGYSDGASKAALVTDLLSKSGPDLLPFLNDLADNYDKVTGTSGAAAGAAAEFQDHIGWLKLEMKGLVTSVAVDVAPTLRDLAGAFSDVYKQQAGLEKGDWSSWADDLGLGFAKASDAVATFARSTSVAWSALKAVRAGFELVNGLALISPVEAAYESMNGGDGLKDIKKSFSDLQQAFADGWKGIDEINAMPTDQFEKAYRARMGSRDAPAESGGGEDGAKPNAPSTGGSTVKDAEKALEEYEALLDRINGKTVGIDPSFYADLGKLYAGYKAGNQTLEEYVATVEKYIGQQPFAKQAEQDRLKALKDLGDFQTEYSKGLEATSGIFAKRVQDAQAEATKNQDLARTYGMTKSAIEQLELARLEEQLSQRSTLGLTLNEIETLEQLIDAKKRNAGAVAQMAGIDAAKKAGEDLDRFLDPTKAQTFGEALKGAFGAAGDSITQLITGLDAYGIRQAEIDKARKDASVKYAGDAKGYADASAAITAKEVKSRLSGYGDMASAAKGFFSEGSKGYGVLSNVEKAYRAAELAMALQTMTRKIFFKQTEVAANTALNATKITGEAAATAASTGLAATEASAWGVTAVVKALASLPFPLNLAAGAATLAAVVAIGAKLVGGMGGGSVPLSQQRQEAQGTGTVLGSDEKSESIARSLETIEDATFQGLDISNGMLLSLRNIEAGIGQFASFLVRSTGVAGDFGSELATKDGNFLSKLGSSIFGGKKTVEDTGFQLKPIDFTGIFNGGVNASQYADVKKSGGWFGSDKMLPQVEGLGLEGNRQIASVLISLYDSVVEAGAILGVGGDEFTAKLNSFVVDIGKVSLKGLSGAEIEEELSAVFSKAGDQLAEFGIQGLAQFQQVGEGYLETLTRVATNYQAVTVVTDSMGMTFGAMGLASVGARERLIDLVGGLDEFTSSADQFLSDFYTDQERANSLRARISPTLDQYGIKTGANDSLQQFRSVVTGLDLTTEAGARAYATLMQIAPAFKQIADVDAARLEARRDLEIEVMELLGNKSGALAASRAAELAGLDASLRPLQERVYALQDEAAALDTSNSLLSLQAQIYELNGDKAGAAAVLAKQQAIALAALDPALRGATLQLWGLQAAAKATEQVKTDAAALMGGVDGAFSVLQKVVERQKKALQEEINVRTKSIQTIEALSQSLRSTLDGMTVQGREAEDRQAAQAQIEAALAIARATGKLPKADDLKSALSIVSRDSAALFATQEDYLRDFYATRNGIEDLSGLSDKALTVEERSLVKLEDQVKQYDLMLEREQEQIDVLKGISVTGLSIEQALEALRGAVLAAGNNPVNSASSAISDAYKSALGRAPDSAGLDFWKDKAASGVSLDTIIGGIKGSPEAQVQKLYQEIFKRPADAGGLQFWVKQMNGGMSAATVREALLGSDEKKLRGFAIGTNRVPYDMPAMVHQDERIIPAADNRELMRRLASPEQGNEVLVAEVRALRAEVALLRQTNSDENYAIAKHSMDAAGHLDDAINGNKPFAVHIVEEEATT